MTLSATSITVWYSNAHLLLINNCLASKTLSILFWQRMCSSLYCDFFYGFFDLIHSTCFIISCFPACLPTIFHSFLLICSSLEVRASGLIELHINLNVWPDWSAVIILKHFTLHICIQIYTQKYVIQIHILREICIKFIRF